MAAQHIANATAGASVVADGRPLPALPTGRMGAVASASPPRGTMMLVPIRLRPAIEILAGRPPIIAGQQRENYFQLLHIAIGEWMPQSLRACVLVVQSVDAEFQILAMKEVQTCLFNSALGADLLAILNGREVPTDGTERGQKCDPRKLQALKNVIFAAFAGDAAAIEYVEEQTGRAIGIGPETPVHLAMPIHIFADRAITTRLARRDAAIRELAAIRAESSGRVVDRRMSVADLRSQLPLAEYIGILTEVDLAKEAEPELYSEQLLITLEHRKAATAAAEASHADPRIAHASAQPVSAPLSSGEEVVRELQKRGNQDEVAASEKGAAAPVSVHAPKRASAPSSPGE